MYTHTQTTQSDRCAAPNAYEDGVYSLYPFHAMLWEDRKEGRWPGCSGRGEGIILNKMVVKDLTEKVLLEGSE